MSVLLTAGMLPDLLFAACIAAGIEHFGAPTGARFADWRLVTPYSHGGVVWIVSAAVALLLGVRHVTTVRSTPRQVLFGAAVAVLLHGIADWVSDPGGLLLFGARGPRSGLALWQHAPRVALAVEVSVVLAGFVAFVRATPALATWARVCLGAVFAAFTWMFTIGQGAALAPPESPAIAQEYGVQTLVTIAVLVGLVHLGTRSAAREVRIRMASGAPEQPG